jgi:hypothetical protein
MSADRINQAEAPAFYRILTLDGVAGQNRWDCIDMPGQDANSYYVDRRSDRRSVETVAKMRHQKYNVEVKVCDISRCGFMAECDDAVVIGSHVLLDVPGIGGVHAQVRWQLAGRMGGMFLDPISLTKCEWTAVRNDLAEMPA